VVRARKTEPVIPSLEATVRAGEQPGPPAAHAWDAPAGARRDRAGVLLRACRPRQWSKNLLVAAAAVAAGVIGHGHVILEVGLAFVSFCALASATYLVNDVRDRDQDRLHPRKRLRPVAAGELSVAGALIGAGVLAGCGLALAFAVRPALAAVGVGYLALTASYSLLWRRVVVLDILAIAAGFVVRAVAGGAAANVALSRWFVLVTTAGALFLAAGKRHAELRDRDVSSVVRSTLRRYSTVGLRVALVGAALVACVAYGGWAFQRPEHGPWYELSMLPLVGWLVRYGVLLGQGAGEAPEQVVVSDRWLLALSVVWAALFLGGVYVGR
jgi:decaprenyl-phosphate phosphoribosyltransferase